MVAPLETSVFVESQSRASVFVAIKRPFGITKAYARIAYRVAGDTMFQTQDAELTENLHYLICRFELRGIPRESRIYFSVDTAFTPYGLVPTGELLLRPLSSFECVKKDGPVLVSVAR